MRNACAMAGLLCAASGAVAGEVAALHPARGLYAGVDVGGSRLVVGDAATAYYWVTDADRISGNDAGYRLRIGYQFSRFIALEAGYTDFGTLVARDIAYSCFPSATDCTFDLRSRIRTAMLGAVATIPFAGRWSVHARLGAVYGRISSDMWDASAGATHDSSGHDGVGYGAGLDVRLGKRTTMSLDWSRHELLDLGPTWGGGIGAYEYGLPSLVSLGLSYRF